MLTPPVWDPNSVPQNLHSPGDEGFYLEDATKHYVPPSYVPDVPERRMGIYPFFHKMANWGVELSGLDPGVNPTSFYFPV